MANAFVYGTLMYPDVLKALIGREPQAASAAISGYARYRIKKQVGRRGWHGSCSFRLSFKACVHDVVFVAGFSRHHQSGT